MGPVSRFFLVPVQVCGIEDAAVVLLFAQIRKGPAGSRHLERRAELKAFALHALACPLEIGSLTSDRAWAANASRDPASQLRHAEND